MTIAASKDPNGACIFVIVLLVLVMKMRGDRCLD
jgi:hypothetical protein